MHLASEFFLVALQLSIERTPNEEVYTVLSHTCLCFGSSY